MIFSQLLAVGAMIDHEKPRWHAVRAGFAPGRMSWSPGVGLRSGASRPRWQRVGIVLCPAQATQGDEVAGEDGGLEESLVAAAPLVGAAPAAAVVLQRSDGGLDAGMMAALPGP